MNWLVAGSTGCFYSTHRAKGDKLNIVTKMGCLVINGRSRCVIANSPCLKGSGNRYIDPRGQFWVYLGAAADAAVAADCAAGLGSMPSLLLFSSLLETTDCTGPRRNAVPRGSTFTNLVSATKLDLYVFTLTGRVAPRRSREICID